jgi:glutamine amidotransferase
MSDIPRAMIVDCGLGNLFSVKHACTAAGMEGAISSDPSDIARADAVILPGVGAFGDAMKELRLRGLVEPLREAAGAGKPMVGICLGLQLFMAESFEFGHHEGLGLFEGSVVKFDLPREGDRVLKVPHLGWNRIHRPAAVSWDGTPLADVADGEHMYFVHSYHAVPRDPGIVLATTRYGHIEYASCLARGAVFACQFHPERSGREGLKIYHTIAARLRAARDEGVQRHG